MTHFTFFTDKGITYNEDFVYTNGEFGFILDGATGMSANKAAAGNSDAQVLSHQLGCYLMNHLGDITKPIQQILNEGITSIRNASFSDYEKRNNVFLPSCTFACFRKKADTVELAWLGDSPIIVKGSETAVYYDKKIEALDNKAIEKYIQILKEGNSSAEARRGIYDILYANRQLKNQPEGYWILDLTEHGIPHLNEKRLPLSEVSQILICSDGFYRIFDLFKLRDITADLTALLQYETLVQLIDQLRAIENQENSLLDYPRLKVSDDASVLAVDFS